MVEIDKVIGTRTTQLRKEGWKRRNHRKSNAKKVKKLTPCQWIWNSHKTGWISRFNDQNKDIYVVTLAVQRRQVKCEEKRGQMGDRCKGGGYVEAQGACKKRKEKTKSGHLHIM